MTLFLTLFSFLLSYEMFNKSNLAIDHYYKECWKKYCEGREVLEELIDISRFECVKSCKEYVVAPIKSS